MKKILMLAMALGLVVSGCGVETSSTGVPVGQSGILTRNTGTTSPVAMTEEIMDTFLKSWRIGDSYGNTNLIMSGTVFLVDHGTKVLVIDSHSFTRKIRILEGEHTGKAGWVPYEWVK